MQDIPETSQPDMTRANVLVSIFVAAQLPLAVVQMDDFDLVETDCDIKSSERRFITRLRTDVVARGENVARIKAYAETFTLVAPLDESRNLFEAMPDCIGLAGSGLDQYSGAEPLGSFVHLAQPIRYAFYACFLTCSPM